MAGPGVSGTSVAALRKSPRMTKQSDATLRRRRAWSSAPLSNRDASAKASVAAVAGSVQSRVQVSKVMASALVAKSSVLARMCAM